MVFFHTSLSVRKETRRTLKKEVDDATGVDITIRTVRRKLLKSGLRGMCGSYIGNLFAL